MKRRVDRNRVGAKREIRRKGDEQNYYRIHEKEVILYISIPIHTIHIVLVEHGYFDWIFRREIESLNVRKRVN